MMPTIPLVHIRLFTFCDIQLSIQEAVARLADGREIETRFEPIKSGTTTHVNLVERVGIIEIIEATGGAFESGLDGQSLDFGMYINYIAKKHGKGRLFLATKPECRLSERQITQSLDNGVGSDIFSTQDSTSE